ncbi:MAG TPA: hypothetical protein VE646_08555 [Actinomycetota bacterium]|nr:hypothetical protein [Actinomycetota bacterium]
MRADSSKHPLPAHARAGRRAALRIAAGRLLALAAATGLAACVVIFRHPDVAPVETTADSVAIRSPVKAHRVDGATVIYEDGVVLVRDTLRGNGVSYDLRLSPSRSVPLLPVDSVVALESYQTRVNAAASIIVSTILTAPLAAGVALAIACATNPKCFGSCPTYYSREGDRFVLEAEGFSYSIAPLLEARDVDRLGARPSPDGVLRLEVRNEALETHYHNHMELLAVAHAPDERVLPDPRGEPIAVRGALAPVTAVDRAGRDLGPVVAVADGHAFESDRRLLGEAATGELRDFIELSVPRPEGVDSVALILRLRNSLLATVLLYDVMLGDPGPRAVDWVGEDLQRIDRAVKLGRWYVEYFGLGIDVDEGGTYRRAAWFRDTGPIAWKELAVPIPVPAGAGDSLRVRLSFVTDNWRIDRLAVAAAFRRPGARGLPVSRVIGNDGRENAGALEALRAPDARYLQVYPGGRFTVEFDAGSVEPGVARTFMVASQGYYIEWIRRAWLRSAGADRDFEPSERAVREAIARWASGRQELEARFAATRIPVR